MGDMPTALKTARSSSMERNGRLSQNDSQNHHHGGTKGFDVWDAEEKIPENDVGVKMTLVSSHLDEGYPVGLITEVSFALNDENGFSISFEASSDRPTPVSLTNHGYFNLSGFSEAINFHHLQIVADRILNKDESGLKEMKKRNTALSVPFALKPIGFQMA